VINGARHEILFEKDDMRAEALNAVIDLVSDSADRGQPDNERQ
jgi:alpha-beta hydrolase superfamily lysophospholipase